MSNTAALQKSLYTAHASAIGGREGHVRTDGGELDSPVVMPPALGGKGGVGVNPEQLFAAGYAACFGSAVGLVARQKGISPESVRVDSEVTIGTIAGGGFGLAVTLRVALAGVPKEQAVALVDAAHQVCPYSNATRGNIEVHLEVL